MEGRCRRLRRAAPFHRVRIDGIVALPRRAAPLHRVLIDGIVAMLGIVVMLPRKKVIMATWNSRGLRGSFLEELINLTNEKYRNKKLALIQKVPTPIKPIHIDESTRHITLAYFEQKSTVDYIGVVQGIPVCFDAKECAEDRFPLANIHEHQMKFMEEFEAQEGIAFLLIYFKNRDCFTYLPFTYLKTFWERMETGGKKSFGFDELNPAYEISTYSGTFVHYLEKIQMDLEERQ